MEISGVAIITVGYKQNRLLRRTTCVITYGYQHIHKVMHNWAQFYTGLSTVFTALSQSIDKKAAYSAGQLYKPVTNCNNSCA